ncbi:methylmalonyl-CoA mutase family protein [Streptomyces sp. NPDC060011]|uniref:methylmalonyl-CoA mutase family protein n=1 Tax=Streptomyces sp. NPDC060011 TaxID=3347037 RepID=UPI00367A7AD6
MEHTATGAPRPPTEPAYGPRALEPFNPARRAGERGGRGPGEAGRRLGFGEADQWLGEPAAHPPTRVVHPPDPDPGADRAPTWWSSTASGTAAECNARHRKLIAAGVRDLSVVFDVPTRAGHDSDAPAARGEVGRAGVAIDSIDDMRVLFAGIPLEEVVTSMRCGACAAPLLLLYQLVAEEQGAAAGRLSGTFHDGGAGECVPDGDRIFPPGPSARLAADLVGYCRAEIPRWVTDACRTGPGARVDPAPLDGEKREELVPADPAAAARQGERIAKLRAWREQREVDAALTALKRTAAGDDNVLPPMREALRARATVGEVCGALRGVWGIRRPADARSTSSAGSPPASLPISCCGR